MDLGRSAGDAVIVVGDISYQWTACGCVAPTT